MSTNRNQIFSVFVGPQPAVRLGVATAVLFDQNVKLEDLASIGRAEDGTEIRDTELRNKDIAGLIANPELSHFFNTIASVATPRAQRRDLKLQDSSTSRYKLPKGISGVDASVLPQGSWNVHSFGWFGSQAYRHDANGKRDRGLHRVYRPRVLRRPIVRRRVAVRLAGDGDGFHGQDPRVARQRAHPCSDRCVSIAAHRSSATPRPKSVHWLMS